MGEFPVGMALHATHRADAMALAFPPQIFLAIQMNICEI
jgi:hypothetical protein